MLAPLTYKVTSDGRFVSRTFTATQVLEMIKKEAIKFIDLQFTDVPGRLRHVTLPSEMMQEEMFREGVQSLTALPSRASLRFTSPTCCSCLTRRPGGSYPGSKTA